MKLPSRILQVVVGGIVLIGTGIYVTYGPESLASENIKIPKLSPVAGWGKVAYDKSCASCHGKNGIGTNTGPPLIHNIYNPGHHDDSSFFRAAKNGVPQHHWPYGNMPSRPELTNGQISAIVKYIRELQQANGIVYKKHVM